MREHPMMDFHTHRMDTPPGEGIVCLPQDIVLHPGTWTPQPKGLYAAGIHPWWTADDGFCLDTYLTSLATLLAHPAVVHLGECGLDSLRGADIGYQEEVFVRQVTLSEELRRPVTIHCVRAFDRLLRLKKLLRPTQQWTVHGFRGRPALARQLLDAGLDLSFGALHNPASWDITPPQRRHRETDSN